MSTLIRILSSPFHSGPSAKELIAQSKLPDNVQSTLTTLIRRTHLWPSEKADLARELISHFQDAIASGLTPADVIHAFGPLDTAAKLIRRAKIRNRSAFWHIIRAIGGVSAAGAVLYVASAVYFIAGKPSISTDYVALFNQPIFATPESDRGWPLYRKALIQAPISFWTDEKTRDELFAARPGSPRYAELKKFIADHPNLLPILREAAAKPAMGFILGPTGSANDRELFPKLNLTPPRKGEEYQTVITVLLPHLHLLRQTSLLLAADIRIAVEAGDASRAIADIRALLGLSRQLGERDTALVTNLVGINVATHALTEFQSALVTRPDLFSDTDLQTLAHLLAGPNVPGDLLSLKLERISFQDVLQRLYTDDGQGKGRLTFTGVVRLSSYANGTPHTQAFETAAIALSGFGPLAASRQELSQTFNRFLDSAERDLSHPSYLGTEDAAEVFSEEYGNPNASLPTRLRRARILPLLVMLPSLSRAAHVAESHLARRDALQTAIALELHKRRQGAYPTTLADLSPPLLPRLPKDPLTGAPMLYRLKDNKPLLYSVGPNKQDDAGAPLKTGDTSSTYPWIAPPTTPGDWLLYPALPEK